MVYTMSYLRLREKRIAPRRVASFYQRMDPDWIQTNDFQSTHEVPNWFAPYTHMSDDKVFLVQNNKRDITMSLFYSPARFIDKLFTSIENEKIPDMHKVAAFISLKEHNTENYLYRNDKQSESGARELTD